MQTDHLWHTEPVDSVLAALRSDQHAGLTETEAQQRQQQYGPNELIDRGGKHPLRLLWEQASSTMVLILIAAVVASAFNLPTLLILWGLIPI